MKVSPINSYLNVSKCSDVSKTTFGSYRKAFCNEFSTRANRLVPSSLGESNDSVICSLVNNFLTLLERFPSHCKSNDFRAISIGLTNITAKKIKNLSDKLNLKVGECREIVTSEGKPYLIVANVGPYETGLFSKTAHDEVIFEFKNPETDEFIGFSLDMDCDLAITQPHERCVYYDMPNEKRYKGTIVGGYKETTYSDLRNKDGSIPQSSFWDLFK
jgi:hypothetical protein